jgi:hypothetical protein
MNALRKKEAIRGRFVIVSFSEATRISINFEGRQLGSGREFPKSLTGLFSGATSIY